jgi:hypothetical protein
MLMDAAAGCCCRSANPQFFFTSRLRALIKKTTPLHTTRNNETNATKQRPGIGDSIAIDMLLLRRLMAAVDDNLPQISQPLVPLVDEFAARLFGELDYVQEGRSAERFQELYGGVPRVRVPKIVWGATARRVLTMEWIDGVKLTDRCVLGGGRCIVYVWVCFDFWRGLFDVREGRVEGVWSW